MKKLTTYTKTDARQYYAVVINGAPTQFRIAVPYSIQTYGGGEFKIGNVRFKANHLKRQATALDPIPDSWLVDLSADVVDEWELESDLL